MTSQIQATRPTDAVSERLGQRLRRLRQTRGLALREVAPAAEIDSPLLSKIEKGVRLPTPQQTAALAAFFDLPAEELEALRLAEKFWRENRDNPAAFQAAFLIEEAAASYGAAPTKQHPLPRLRKQSSSRRQAVGRRADA